VDGRPTVWDNDAVQLCAQGMLLEEDRGVPVRRGFQFHVGSRERVEVPFTPELSERTRAAAARCRELSERDAPPDPLPAESRHRCFGCSLAPVCLPEETLYQIGTPTAGETSSAALTRVIPGSDDGAVLYLQEPGAHVGKRGEHLTVRKHDQELARVPMHQLRQVCVFGNVQVSTQALQTLLENEIPVAYLTGHGRFVGLLTPPPAKNVGLREAQYRHFADPAGRLGLAKEAVRAKLTNQRTLLMRSLRGEGDRGSNEPAARGLARVLRRLDEADSLEALLGLEGQGAALYFGEFGRFLREDSEARPFDFTARNRRPPRDPVNALLSFAYALLTKDCFAAVCAVGFDPYKGFYHASRHGKPALALDLMEEFRPVIADSVVLTLVNTGMVGRGDFVTWRDAVQLTESGRRAFFAAYEQRKAAEVTHPLYGYRMTYSRMLEVQARMLAAFVRGTVPSYRGFTVR
jgi:CRISPR-associated protein Cas1